MMKPMRVIAVASLFFCLAAFGCSREQEQAKQEPPAPAKAAKKEYTFRGKIEKIDANAKTFTVNGEKIEGWMDAMAMIYVPDKADVLDRVKAGDQITARVYDGDYRTLYDVQVVAGPPAETPAKK